VAFWGYLHLAVEERFEMNRDPTSHLKVSVKTEHPYEEEGEPEPLIFIEDLNQTNENESPWVVLWLRKEEAVSLKHKLQRMIHHFPYPCVAGAGPEPQDTTLDDPEWLARLFHETYERLAPSFGYKTRKASAVPWKKVPEKNRKLMIAVAAEIQKRLENRGGGE
jgi:hypothetical protein